MLRKGKRYRADAEKAPKEALPLEEAVKVVKSFKPVKFDQTVELCMHLGIDPRQADQMIRGSLSLPHGISKTKRVICFCTADKVEAAKAAGAIEAGDEDLVKKIEGGWMDFDVAIADPALMKVVSRLGRTLGPKGLMPTPKAGTVTPNIEQAIKEYSAGKVNFKNDEKGNVHVVIGKFSFDAEKLIENAQTFISYITRIKPSSSKGQYIRKVSISATMTPGVHIAVG